jgi:hypothetical protein
LAIVENREDAVYIQVIYKLYREVFGVLACPRPFTTWTLQVVLVSLRLGGPKSLIFDLDLEGPSPFAKQA